MDQVGKYEQLIGEKLEQIPLPDLMEAIWTRIETELDTDLPDGDQNDPGAGPRGGIFGGKFILFICALIMTFFFYQNNKKQPIESSPVLPHIETTSPVIKPPDDPVLIKSSANRSVAPKVSTKDTGTSITPVFTQQDQPALVGLDDSARSNPPPLVIVPPSIVDKDTTGKKKSRGVKGLGDDDYKIVPKKDSSRK